MEGGQQDHRYTDVLGGYQDLSVLNGEVEVAVVCDAPKDTVATDIIRLKK